MTYQVLKDDQEVGHSINLDGAFRILTHYLCQHTGSYQIHHDGEAIRVGMTETVIYADQPLWAPERIEAWRARQPYTKKHLPRVRHFCMDLFDKSVEGYCLGQTWNGWRVPYFTKAQMEAVMTQCNEHYDNEMDLSLIHI